VSDWNDLYTQNKQTTSYLVTQSVPCNHKEQDIGFFCLVTVFKRANKFLKNFIQKSLFLATNELEDNVTKSSINFFHFKL
jgi:hypothetical protein